MKLFSFLPFFRLQSDTDHESGMDFFGEVASNSNPTNFLDVPFIDDDFWKLLFKFSLNLFVLIVIIRYIYYPTTKRKDYLFTYLLISVITFFICFVLKKNDLGLGLALGLFAVFGIIRYRTDAVPIKEMTYLFIVIGISVMNALANKKVSYSELFFTNFSIIALIYILERIWLIRHESSKLILYEKIDLIKPQNKAALIQDLEERTGLKINRVSVGKVDFLRDTAQVTIYYFDDDQTHISEYSSGNSNSNGAD